MKTISQLRNALHEVSHSPYDLFRSYRGTDWKDYVRYSYGKHCYPHVLWTNKNNTMELVIMGWKEHQTYYTYTNYNTIYSRVLQGGIYCTEKNIENMKSLRFIQESSFCVIPPFSIIDMKASRTAASLHLFHYCYPK